MLNHLGYRRSFAGTSAKGLFVFLFILANSISSDASDNSTAQKVVDDYMSMAMPSWNEPWHEWLSMLEVMRVHGEEVLSILTDHVQDPEAEYRIMQRAIVAIGMVGAGEHAMIPRRKDKKRESVEVDNRTIDVLEEVVRGKHIERFDDDRRIKLIKAAAEALGFIGQKAHRTVPALVEILQNTKIDKKYRVAVLFAIHRMRFDEQKTISILVERLGDPDSGVRNAALNTLTNYGKAAVPDLINALKEGSETQRQEAASTLGVMGKEAGEAAEALANAVEKDNRHIASLAMQALAAVEPPSHPAAAKLLEDPDTEVRRRAAKGAYFMESADASFIQALAGGLSPIFGAQVKPKRSG